MWITKNVNFTRENVNVKIHCSQKKKKKYPASCFSYNTWRQHATPSLVTRSMTSARTLLTFRVSWFKSCNITGSSLYHHLAGGSDWNPDSSPTRTVRAAPHSYRCFRNPTLLMKLVSICSKGDELSTSALTDWGSSLTNLDEQSGRWRRRNSRI